MNYFVYVLSNKKNGVLYIGVTNNLVRRVYEHKQGMVDGFSKRYNIKKLMYYEIVGDIKEAIKREKQLKKRDRSRKIELIEKNNNERIDLYENILG